MDEVAVEESVRRFVAEILEVEPSVITMNTVFRDDLGANSMAALEIMARLETAFDIVISPEDLPELASFRRVLQLVQRLAGAG